MPTTNRQITLAARPVGLPRESDFRLIESPVPKPKDGEFLVQIHYLSVDPYMRGRMTDRPSYAPPIQIGEVMVGGAVGQVIESQNAHFPNGVIVEGRFGWQQYALNNGEGVRLVDPSIAPISTALGILGMPGFTAYFGLLDICHPRPGETVLVSGAAGAVGSAVGQIAKIQGCHVVGVAGSEEKIAYLKQELGFDAAFNYKGVADYHAKLREACPAGIDVYFDNVGGPLTDAVFPSLTVGAGRDLWPDLAIQPGETGDGSTVSVAPDRQAGQGPGLSRLRLRGPLQGSGAATIRVAAVGKT